MGVPKTRKSKSRKRMRQSHNKAVSAQTVKCKKCGALKRPHTKCAACKS